jgi:hypothetical protein
MHKALGQGQRAFADVNRQDQFGDGVHGHPHPVRRSRQTFDGFGVSDLTVFDRTEQSKGLCAQRPSCGARHEGRWAHNPSIGGLVVGDLNEISGDFASVSGGQGNTTSGGVASVSGGQLNIASGVFSSVSGGIFNTASGTRASVSGGRNRTAPAEDDWTAGSLFEDE